MIHQYKNNGYNIVLDVNSGSVHVVDDIVYDIIPAVEKQLLQKERKPEEVFSNIMREYEQGSIRTEKNYTEAVLKEAVEEILELYAAGMLFTEDIYEKYIAGFGERQTVVKALCLHIAHDCNLACQYCFAQEGEYHGRRALMSFGVGKKALDFLVAASGNRVNLEVDFFGGEPLLNWDVVKRLVEYGRSIEKEYHNKIQIGRASCRERVLVTV